MDWEGVCEFVAVTQEGSFTHAASKLDTSVAQISRKVNALEQRLGVKLLQRTTRKITLTEAGQVYFQQCHPLVEGLQMANLAVTSLQQKPQGKIKMTAPVAYGERFFVPLINQLLVEHPQLELDLVLSNRNLDLMDHGFDIAIRVGRLEDSSLVAKRLTSRQLYVCASREYLQRYGEPHSLSELSSHQLLVGSADHWHFRSEGLNKSIKVQGRMKCNSGNALLDAAKRGLGLVQLPDYYVNQALQSGELVEVLAAFREQREGIWAVYPQNRYLSPKVRLVIDYLSEHLS